MFYSWKKRRFIIMRGNKRLVQGIAVAGAAGVLVCTVTFSQPQIMQTEETIQITENKTAGIMTAVNLKAESEDSLEQELSIAKLDVDRVSSVLPVSELNINTWTDDAVMPENKSILVPAKESTSVSKKTDKKEAKKITAKKENVKENKQTKTDSAKKWKNKEKTFF